MVEPNCEGVDFVIYVYECEFCDTLVQCEDDFMEEHNKFKCCRNCFERESDTGEV